MARLDRDGLVRSISDAIRATPDPQGVSDLVAERGHLNVAATAADVKTAIERLKPISGYRWIVINAADLFVASPVTLGTKVGILDPSGRVLKNADLPRAK
ncbi:MAG TPA: hypothetical protein VEU77_09780 [Candidatus Acidoferrales bacterium]|nr:hypothetical protein [Candidatus Acidoferrales bacterium]